MTFLMLLRLSKNGVAYDLTIVAGFGATLREPVTSASLDTNPAYSFRLIN